MLAAARTEEEAAGNVALTCRTSPPQSSVRSYKEPRPAPPDFTINIIDSIAQFENLKTEWDQLHGANSQNHLAFQAHSWCRAWLAAYRSEINNRAIRIAIIVARVGGDIRVICPLAVRNVLGMKCLTWLGEPASQYGDVITDGSRDSEQLIGPTLSFALDSLQPDIVHLRKVRNDASISTWIKSQNATATSCDAAAFLDLRSAHSFDAYCSRYSSKSRKNRRRLRRRLEEMDQVETTVLPAGRNAQDAIRTGIEFKQAWLVERGEICSALSDNHMCDFLTTVVTDHNSNASPFISIMHCGSTPVSVQFGVLSHKRLSLHLIAYNPETEKTGAGVLHIEDTIRHCIETGYLELDFLAPNAPYKQAWADASIPVVDYVLTRSIRGRLYARAYLQNARNAVKNRLQMLPLGFRQSIAKRMQN